MSHLPETPLSAAPWIPSNPKDPYKYLSGFGSHFETEALEGALPKVQNSPQVCPYKAYTECLSGTAFTAPRTHNLKAWLYRIVPSVGQGTFKPYTANPYITSDFHSSDPTDPSSVKSPDGVYNVPHQARWSPFPLPEEGQSVDFLDGLRTVCGSGHPASRHGLAIHVYAANADMKKRALYNSDGDFLVVPQQGRLDITTEFGKISVAPNEIVVIPRGVRFSVALPDGPSRGYIAECYAGHYELPDLGPIGANGLANPRDFLHPVAWFEEDSSAWTVVSKFGGKLFEAELRGSPFNVIAWHGNYAPYKYDLQRFMVINTVSYDHADPSIFTVLTCKSAMAGTAYLDFVIFPPRWGVADWTFRPPWYHRNSMTEFMGLIKGKYEAKESTKGGGFHPGGATLHSMMSAHGPDALGFEKGSGAELHPVRVADNTQAFMFESYLQFGITKWAWEGSGARQPNYMLDSWGEIKPSFDKTFKGTAAEAMANGQH
ncbi:homogentisate 1,2-dioxygenase HgmA [Gonapodya prolifera JEL478]|uniref:homogentisate 1,2-dioxygenase n=1 Tax=Gonapodya prolifera (strain JEL478) TaxID=1344416 RepID=A0A139AKL1_GONPJ|nr:homogentisate 1,2-dioxygenase HgmA [Gonapodya prolifera JEL478]|eukprot:KXS17307.1 homogentisate 1,2-dioxygenase HgmA [Gonapodya prolifera JEL478]